MRAETIILNARVRTMDADRPEARAIAIAGERILALGSDAEVEATASPATRRIDAKGATVLPGFIESHAHLFLGGAELRNLQLHGAGDPVEIGARVRDFAARHPERGMILAQGPDYSLFADRPPRLVLDEMLADRPFAMIAHDHHTVWANTAALEAAGDLQGRETPPGHEVVMGPDGLATGALYEPFGYGAVMALSGQDRAMQGLNDGGEPATRPTEAEWEEDLGHIARGLAHAAAYGITTILNMDGNLYTLELLDELRRRGELTARVRVPFHFVPDMEEGALARARQMTERWDDDWLSSGFVKLFMDGVIDSRTAFMKHDYPGQPGYRSAARFEADRFARLATEINAMGLAVAVHSIGDAATERTIDGFAASWKANGPHDLRNRIEHLELVDGADFARLGDLAITASVQPPHAPGTAGLPLEPTLGNIGRDRWADAFAWQRLVAAGAPIALGSDWPVSPISPFVGLHAATTREAWAEDVPDHRFTLDEALRGYTLGGARSERTERDKGSLAPGKLADLVVLDREIGEASLGTLPETQVRLTMAGGRVVYEA